MYTAIFDSAEMIREALRTAFGSSTSPPATYRVGVGQEFAMDAGGLVDMCCDGAIAIMVGDTTAVPGSSLLGTPLSLLQDFMVLVLRCSPGMDDSGRVPTEQQELDSSRLVLDDRERLLVCMSDFAEANNLADGEYSEPTVVAIEPQGGCCGNMMSFVMAIGQDC
jgi:hypothetical protein